MLKAYDYQRRIVGIVVATVLGGGIGLGCQLNEASAQKRVLKNRFQRVPVGKKNAPAKRRRTPVAVTPKAAGLTDVVKVVRGYLPGTGIKREIRYTVRDGNAIYQGDIILGPADKLEKRLRKPNLPKEALKVWKKNQKAHGRMAVRAGGDYLWKKGRIPFAIDMASFGPFGDDSRKKVLEAISELNRRTNLNVVPAKKSDKNRIVYKMSSGCSSSVGKQGGLIKVAQDVNTGWNCGVGSMMHETLHAAGFWHTQSREDRDKYVTVRKKNVKKGKGHNFDKHGDNFGDYFTFQVGKIVPVPYDHNSIMHYGSCYFAKDRAKCASDLSKATIVTKSGKRIHGSRVLAATDIKGINAIYKKNGGNYQPKIPKSLPMKVSGYWGTWASSYAACPSGSYAYAFRQRVEKSQGGGHCGKGFFGSSCKNDDTALNAIQLKCRNAAGKTTKTLKSKESPWGTWSGWKSCGKGKYITGFRLSTEQNQGSTTDDTAANGIRFTCSDNTTLAAGNDAKWGTWVSERKCKSGQYIRSFRTQVEGKQGSKKDDTGLNGVDFKCAGKGSNTTSKLICDEGVRSGASNCKVTSVKLKRQCVPGRIGCPYWIDTKYNGVFKSAAKKGNRYVCDEGVRSGARNCKVKSFKPKVKEPAHCRTLKYFLPSFAPFPMCTYWIDTRYKGVFKKALLNPKADTVQFVYKWYGTRPFCAGKKRDCTKRGMEYVRRARRGCTTGKKVLCRKAK